jgi:hypothetical protein
MKPAHPDVNICVPLIPILLLVEQKVNMNLPEIFACIMIGSYIFVQGLWWWSIRKK